MKYCFKKVVTLLVAAVVAMGIISVPAAAKTYEMVEYGVPAGNTYFKTYMSYKAITDTTSAQYELQQEAYTDDSGLRKIGSYYVVVMGSYYAKNIGDKFLIYLDTGEKIKVIIGDFKADEHTDETNRYRNVYNSNGDYISKNVIEFIVDITTLDETAKNWGDISAIDGFKGNISAIYKLEEMTYEKE